jgi:O-antigen ligase
MSQIGSQTPWSALARARLAAPAAATAALCVGAGGFFPGLTAFATVAALVGLLLRITLARRPWEGWSAGLSVAAGALALFAVWTLLSSHWSGAPGRALLEFDRTLLYLAVFVVSGLFAARAGNLAVVLRWTAAAACGACLAGLATRLAPGSFPTSLPADQTRLAFPLTYWNSLGLLAAVALVLALHVTASIRQPRVARVLAAAAFPAVAVALYFTFSRGGSLAAVFGLAVYLVLGYSRGFVPALIAIVPATAFVLQRAFDADLLAGARFDQPVAAAQRGDLLKVVIACVLAAGLLRAGLLFADRALARIRLSRRVRLGAKLVAASLVALLAAGAVAGGVPARVERERQALTDTKPRSGEDLRVHLTTWDDNSRYEHWRVARDAFRADPLHGTGAGTYQRTWERERPSRFKVRDAHSLYLEVLSELGWPGMLFLGLALATPFAFALARIRGPERHAHAAFIAAGGALLVHAGVDWDWEMPALFVWFFGASGVVLARRRAASPSVAPPARVTRLVAGLACLGLAVTPVLVLQSQGALDRSNHAFRAGDCGTAIDAALDSIGALPARAEPFEILGYCDARAGRGDLAMRAMRSARARDPDGWEYAYGLAVTQALAGQDPSAAVADARRLNPLEPKALQLQRAMRLRSPARRARAAGRLPIPYD